MQEIMWNGKKALLVQIDDMSRKNESLLREYLEEHDYIERVIFTVNPMFIPKDFRDLSEYTKNVVVTDVPNRKIKENE